MTSAAIGNLTLAIIFLAVVFTVIGALASVNWIWRKTWRYSARRIGRRSF